MAVLLDLDLRLQPAVLGLLRPIERLSHRSGGGAARPDPGGGDRRRFAGARWIVYDLLCKSPLAKNDALLALVGFGYVVATSYAYTLVFSGRGALIHTGALMATMMTANVFLVIMPNTRKSVRR